MRPVESKPLSVEQLMPRPAGVSRPRKQPSVDYLLSAAAVCNLFGITYMTLWNWQKEKDFPVIKVAGARRPIIVFSARDVRAWAERQGFGYLTITLPR